MITAVVVGVFALATFIFWIWMLIDCIQNPSLDGTAKIVWVLVILFLHLLGAIVYYFVARQPSRG